MKRVLSSNFILLLLLNSTTTFTIAFFHLKATLALIPSGGFSSSSFSTSASSSFFSAASSSGLLSASTSGIASGTTFLTSGTTFLTSEDSEASLPEDSLIVLAGGGGLGGFGFLGLSSSSPPDSGMK